MSSGYFLAADILGFGEIITNLDPNEQDKKIDEWQELVERLTSKYKIKQFQLISDTLFVGMTDDVTSLQALVDFCSELLTITIRKSLPIRGAIAKGQFTWGKHLVYGRAVIAAHKHEVQQNWIGISFVPNTDGLNTLWGKLICYQIPKKAGENRMGAAIRWDIPSLDELSCLLVSGGLTTSKTKIDQKWLSRLEQTIMFSLYIKLIEKSSLDFSQFHGLGTPVHVFEQHFKLK